MKPILPAEDIVIMAVYRKNNFVLLDTEASFAQSEEIAYENITYTREFMNTEWQALYVPFEIPVTEALLADFEFADLNDIRQYDRDDDGVKDETVLEAFKVKSGTLKANYPYLIRAKESGEKSITVADATLCITEENSYDCSSLHDVYTFTGSYNTLSSVELPQSEGYYALSRGVWRPVAEDATLGAFRFYLKVDSRYGHDIAAQTIRMRIIGEGTTSIENIESTDNGQQPTVIYDLQGRKVVL